MRKPGKKAAEAGPLRRALVAMQELCWQLRKLSAKLTTRPTGSLSARERAEYELAEAKKEKRRKLRQLVYEARASGMPFRDISMRILGTPDRQRAEQIFTDAVKMHARGWLYPKPPIT